MNRPNMYKEKSVVSTNASFAMEPGENDDMDNMNEDYDSTGSNDIAVTGNCILL